MRVVANSIGYLGALRVAGDEFEVPEGVTGSWFAPAVVEADVKPAGKGKRKGSDADAAGDEAADAI